MLSVSSGLNHVDESLPSLLLSLLVLLFCTSVSLWAQAIVLSIFFSPCCCRFSVNCFQLITRSLTHCSSLLSSFPCCCCCFLLCCSFTIYPFVHLALHLRTPLPHHLHITLSGSVSLRLPLLFSLQELKEFSWDQVRDQQRLFEKKFAQHAAYLSLISSLTAVSHLQRHQIRGRA